jgi:MAC/Perforin domain
LDHIFLEKRNEPTSAIVQYKTEASQFDTEKMFLFSIFVLVLASGQVDAQSRDEVNAAIVRVRQNLRRSASIAAVDETPWLKNSGKIGAGYDLITGSPVCYTGQCQMDGFRPPIFKLDMSQQAYGSCTSKTIPKNVHLDCLPSSQITANTESISTLDQLMQSMKTGIDASISVSVYGNSFSYSHSRETRSMIDTIIQSNSSVFFTRATISWLRLTAFIPLLELSDEFRYVIDNLPCCNESEELDQYIRECITEYFGLMYVNDLLLGGIAQQKIVISEENRKNLQQNGFTDMDQVELKLGASAAFSISGKLAMTQQLNQTKLNSFNRFSQQSSITSLGGSTTIQSIENWSETVPSNPTIVKFGIRHILNLLTRTRFPNDSNIASKRSLIQRAQQKYTNTSLSCYDDCTSPSHGECVSSGYFQFGLCQCKPGWSGISCSKLLPKPAASSGLICGLRTGAGTNCGQINPDSGTCPSGYNSDTWLIGETGTGVMRFCSKKTTDTNTGLVGTICGLTTGSGGPKCGGLDPWSEGCPDGYARYEWIVQWGSQRTAWCYKIKEGIADQSGTICGMQTNNGDTGYTCNGYYPARGSCPSDYYLVTRSVTFGDGSWSFCVKK